MTGGVEEPAESGSRVLDGLRLALVVVGYLTPVFIVLGVTVASLLQDGVGLWGSAALFLLVLVLASAGYPESSSKGDAIDGLAAAAELAEVTHAGTAERDGEIVTAGGRVLNLTALGPSPAAARDRAYDAASRVSFEGMQIRSDIAARAVERVPS